VLLKESVDVDGGVGRVVNLMEENNLGLLNLVLHLLFRAGMTENGKVALTQQDLQLLDKYLLKPEDVFPALKDVFNR